MLNKKIGLHFNIIPKSVRLQYSVGGQTTYDNTY